MCTVSAVLPQMQDTFKPYFPGQPVPNIGPFTIGGASVGEYVPQHIRDLAKDVKDVLERLDRIDKALGLRDCKEEAATKEAFLAQLAALSEAAAKL